MLAGIVGTRIAGRDHGGAAVGIPSDTVEPGAENALHLRAVA